ncbi:hypothetical protein LJK88_16920 [Paenibacillus sp. P26]|nr:hypothetical protein LJK88_16920 [Paenibacillus sp. P26]
MYRGLLAQTKKPPDCRLILMQPTVMKEDPDSAGNRLVRPYVETVNRLAEEFDAVLVPTHEAFLEFIRCETGQDLTTDGVHMTSLGDTLMAVTWLKAMGIYGGK